MSASDGDDDVITYWFASADEHFAINASTGQIDLVKSLDRESVQEVRLEVWATDNGNFRLLIRSPAPLCVCLSLGCFLFGSHRELTITGL